MTAEQKRDKEMLDAVAEMIEFYRSMATGDEEQIEHIDDVYAAFAEFRRKHGVA